MLVFGLIWLGVGIGVYIHTNTFIQKAIPAKGTVTELVRVQGSKGEATYASVILFQDHTGREIEFTSDSRSNPPSYTVGETVDILYETARPEQEKSIHF